VKTPQVFWWVVERTFSLISHNRSMSKDYERKDQTSETLIQVAMIRLLLARLGRKSEPDPLKERVA
jgi:putative transposase